MVGRRGFGQRRILTLSKLVKNVPFLTQVKMSCFSSSRHARVPSHCQAGMRGGGASRRPTESQPAAEDAFKDVPTEPRDDGIKMDAETSASLCRGDGRGDRCKRTGTFSAP